MAQFDLELKSLKKIYPGGMTAVEGFDLEVEKGELISFVGPSGCGKTTTLRMIAGLESITSGKLLIRGRDFTNVPAEKRPTATIFQNYAIFPHMSVYENLCFGLEVRGLSKPEIKQKVNAIVDVLELGDVVGVRETALSGGQKQRVALARGLVTQPEILLLDEPLGALDANLRKSIQEELKILQRELGITFIFVTHAQSEALAMGDRVVVMNAGKVEQISDPFELYTRPSSGFVARFIGRNIITPGTIIESSGSLARIKTSYGFISGVSAFDSSKANVGDRVLLVTPSEYVKLMEPSSAPIGDDMNMIKGTICHLNQIGNIIQVDLKMNDNLSVRIETHRDKISNDGMSNGRELELQWCAERSTVVLDAV